MQALGGASGDDARQMAARTDGLDLGRPGGHHDVVGADVEHPFGRACHDRGTRVDGHDLTALARVEQQDVPVRRLCFRDGVLSGLAAPDDRDIHLSAQHGDPLAERGPRSVRAIDDGQRWQPRSRMAHDLTEVCERVVAGGHEVGYHGYCHEAPPSQRPVEEERAILEKSIECIERLTGQAPVGHRVPGGNVGERWLGLLLEHGFSYDWSMAPNDYAPTYCRLGDVVRTDAAFCFGTAVDLVELPFDWILDDWPYFTYEAAAHHEGLRSPTEVFDIWSAEFDYLDEEVGSGVFVLTMHPQCIGRGSRMRMLRRLIEHIRSRDGVRFRTMADVAAQFRREQPLPS